MVLCALGLGSNIGDKLAFVNEAVRRLDATDRITVLKRSANYRTEPWGLTDQDWFLNICILIETPLSAEALLDRCLAVEKELGRVRNRRWGPRKIDIDVLIYGEETIGLDGLTIPHPRMCERAFVLVPLADIWPDAKIGAQTVLDAMRKRDDLTDVRLLDEDGNLKSA